jgi:alpha-glucoside transport system permease protein
MTSQGQEVTGAPPPEEAPPPPRAGAWRKYAIAAGFMAPAALFLLVWIIYPALLTVHRSFYDRTGDTFVWFDNYQTLFTSDILLTAIRNSFLWIFVVPALVTAIGLIFAVLTERVSWSVAFKTVVFMPMAISLFAAGVIWRAAMYPTP